MDYYAILGVARNATPEDVKSAYRKLAMKYHPDRNPGDKEAEAKFKEVQTAYDTLNDPSSRANYDRFGSQPQAQRGPGPFPGGHPFSGPMGRMWQEFYGGSNDRGRNVQVRLDISFKEMLSGCAKDISLKRRGQCSDCKGQGATTFKKCPRCHGSGFQTVSDGMLTTMSGCNACGGRGQLPDPPCNSCLGTGWTPQEDVMMTIEVPAGMDSGMRVRVGGQGEPGRNGSAPGDLHVLVVVKPHLLFERRQADIVINVPVSYTQLVRGCEIELPNPHGGTVVLKVPEGTRPMTELHMKKLGVPALAGYSDQQGDYIAKLILELPPADPNLEYNDALELLGVLEKKYVTPERRLFEERRSANNA